MTGEEIGYAMDRLFAEGARDVYTTPIGMKKNRPGIMLSVICLADDADRLASIIMKYSTTLGIRRIDCSRYILKRDFDTVETEFGPVKIKHSYGMGTDRFKPEYDDLAAAATRNGVSVAEVRLAAEKAYSEKNI